MKNLNNIQRTFIYLLLICLLGGEFTAAAKIALASNKSNKTTYSQYSIKDGAKLLGIKAGLYGFYFDTSSEKTYSTINSTPTNVVVTSINGTKKSNTNKNKVFKNILSSITPTNTPNTSTSTPSSQPTESIMDNSDSEPKPEPTERPTITNAPSNDQGQNLVKNSSFENLENGLATNWRHSNNAGVFLDTTSQGDSGTNSLLLKVKLGATGYVFSDTFAIDSSETYRWTTYVKAVQGSLLSLYIDEYDENDNWISGRRTGNVETAYNGYYTISYTPTSNNVKRVGLQYTSGYGNFGEIYIDSIYFGK